MFSSLPKTGQPFKSPAAADILPFPGRTFPPQLLGHVVADCMNSYTQLHEHSTAQTFRPESKPAPQPANDGGLVGSRGGFGIPACRNL